MSFSGKFLILITTMKNPFFYFLTALVGFCFMAACHSNHVPHRPPPPGFKPPPPTAAPSPPKKEGTKPVFDPQLTWSGTFKPSNSSAYKKILRGFSVCGQGVGISLHLNWNFSTSNHNDCDTWTNPARMQLNFKKKELPSQAVLVIYPQAHIAGRVQASWRHIRVQGRAVPVNDSDGFNIYMTGGLVSNFPIIARSERHLPEDDHILQVNFYIDTRVSKMGRATLRNEAGQGSEDEHDDNYDSGR